MGADLRFEGRQVLTRGDALRADQLTLEAEAAVRVRRIEADFQVFEQEKQATIDEANRKLELRTRELERTKDLRREECDAAEKKERDEEGAASSATLAKHRDILDSIDQEIEGA